MPFQPMNDHISSTEDYQSNKEYVGVVTNNADPMGLARVQASIPGLFDPQSGEVPWIGPKKQSPFGIGPGFGTYGAPAIGSKITVMLQDGDENHPMYTGFVLAAPDVDDVFKDPNVWGFKDPAGNTFKVDLVNKTWYLDLSTGYSFHADNAGNVAVTVPQNLDVSSGGKTTFHAASFAFVSSGAMDYTASQHNFHGPVVMDSTLQAAGSITDETASGNTKTIANLRQIYNLHTHHENGEGSNTNVPNQQI